MTANPARTVGVEEEFLLVGRRDARLRSTGEAIAEAADAASDGQFEHEFKREQAELGGDPQVGLADVQAELVHRRAELARSAADRGARIVATATAPLATHATTTPDRRYERMVREYGETARGALSCGMHVHVAVESRAEGVRVLDAIRGWLPVVLALTANSPFHDGADTGYESYRSLLWQQWPSAGPTGPFADTDEYDAVVAALLDTGAALDVGMVYFDARLSANYPTVEIRVADVCPRVEDAVTVAGLARALIAAAADGALPAAAGVSGRVEVARAAAWRAARFGMRDRLWHPVDGALRPAWDVVTDLTDRLYATLADDAERVRDGLAAIRDRGTGSELQRAVFAETGDLGAVVAAVADLTVADPSPARLRS